MDKIYIEDLEVFANHGVFEEEKTLGQKFLVSAKLYLDLQKSGMSDNLEDTVNYGQICYDIEEVLTNHTFDLIETAAENVAQYVLSKYESIYRIKLKIKKPWAPIKMSLNHVAVEVDRSRHIAYIGIGSNMGDKQKNIDDAIKLMDKHYGIKVTKQSKCYVTKPFGYLDQDDFLNCVVQLETYLNPEKLIEVLLGIENELKRKRVIKWGPRTIDLDILLYDEIVSSKESVIIPHPMMQDRMFVLEPLNEIAPYALHPLLNKRVNELKKELENKESK